MRLRTRVERLIVRMQISVADAPSTVIYLPDNGRGDAPPGRYRAVVIYDPADPPPELQELDDTVGPDVSTGGTTRTFEPSGPPPPAPTRYP